MKRISKPQPHFFLETRRGHGVFLRGRSRPSNPRLPMPNALTLPAPARLPGLTALAAGTALTLAAALCFFAWNWFRLPEAARFSLAGGAVLLCLILTLAAERKGRVHAASLALLGAALFTGMFWAVFGQVFQSGATVQDLCLAWALCVVPLFALRRTASLWNLLVLLLCAASWKDPGHLLPPLLASAACCLLALVPFLRQGRSLNARLLLPLTLLLTAATAQTGMDILSFADRASSPAASLAAPAFLLAVLVPALRTRHAPALCACALSALVLLNLLLFRLFEDFPATTTALLFAGIDIACTLALACLLPRWLQGSARLRPPALAALLPAALGGLLSAVSLLALAALLLGDSPAAMLGAGITAMACGMALWRRRGRSVFVSVLASVLTTGGTTGFHVALFDYAPAVMLAGVWTAALLLYLFMDGVVLRFSAEFWALVTSIFTLPGLVPSGMPLFLLCFLLFFLPLGAAALGRFPRDRARPAALACIGALVLISLFPLSHSPLEEKTATVVATANLALLILRMLPPRRSPAFPRPAECAAGACALLLTGFFSPLSCLTGLNLLFAALTVGRATTCPAHDCDRTLLLTGVVLLALSLVIFYYGAQFTFPELTLAMGIPGLCLLLAGTWLERRIPREKAPVRSRRARLPLLRHALPFALLAVLLTAVACAALADRKALLREGQEILLALRPQDPRAFMLGDFMNLRYEAEGQLLLPGEGPFCLPLEVDEHGVARPSPDGAVKHGDCDDLPFPALPVEASPAGFSRLALPHRYYFEQGLAPLYARAAFAVLRCDGNRRCLLSGLADQDRRPLLPEHSQDAPPR